MKGEENSAKRARDKSGIMNEIYGLIGEINIMGANDEERSAIEAVLHDITKGKQSPQEGLEKINAIKNNKTDYH